MTVPPRRLLDDPEVSAHLRGDLRQAAAHPGPDFDLDEAVARFEGDLSATATPGGARRRWVIRFVAGSVVLGGTTLAAAAIGVGGWFAPDPGTPVTQPAQPVPAPREATAQPRPDPVPQAPAAAPEATEPSAVDPTPSARRRTGAKTPTTDAPTRDELLRREVDHLAGVRGALGGSPARALRLANEGHGEFRGGALYVEREALAISALSRLGRRSEARARGERLLKAYPRHPFAEQVRRQTGAR